MLSIFASLAFFLFSGFEYDTAVIGSAISGFAVFFGNHLYMLYEIEKSKSKANMQASDALYIASSLPENASPEKSMKIITFSTENPIKKIFKKTVKRIERGESFYRAMQKIKKENKGKQIELMADLFVLWHKTGSDCRNAFRKTAETMSKTHAMQLEEKAALTIQRLTIILSSAILVPLILGLLLSFTTSFSDTSFEESIGEPKEKRVELNNAIKTAIPAYIIEVGVISGLMLALQERKPKKIVVYLATLPVTAIIVFYYFSNGL